MISPVILFLGFGYTSQFTAQYFTEERCEIYGTTRSNKELIFPKTKNVHLVNFSASAIAAIIDRIEHVVVSVPPTIQDNSYDDSALSLMESVLKESSNNLQSITYLSTTSIYGDHEGRWVNETTQPNPNNARSNARLQSEQGCKELCNRLNIKLRIFRLAGIYGPGRNALMRVKDGSAKSIFKDGQVFSRIHVEDIANIIHKAIMQKPDSEGIYNIADDYPCSTIEVNNYAAKLLSMPEPEIVHIDNADLSVMGKEFYSSCRRVSNDKVKQLLQIRLLYPTYREGLEAIHNTF